MHNPGVNFVPSMVGFEFNLSHGRFFHDFDKGENGVRTRDLHCTKVLFCQLNYLTVSIHPCTCGENTHLARNAL